VTAAIHPILLTGSAAALGMIPIAPTVFWGPMAYSIIGGLAVATVLTLIFLPALYVAWFRSPPPRLWGRLQQSQPEAGLRAGSNRRIMWHGFGSRSRRINRHSWL
jgi:multidrug efflux pump